MRFFVMVILGMLGGEAILTLLHLAGHIEPARSLNSAATTVVINVGLLVWGLLLLSRKDE